MAKQERLCQPIVDHIIQVMNACDKSGKNSQSYKEYFDKMTDDELCAWIENYLSDPHEVLSIEMDTFEDNVTIEDIKHAAIVANVLLEDNLVRPDISQDPDDPYVTNHKILIGNVNKRRLQQAVSVKNHMSVSVSQRNPKTGQVINEDKNGRISDMELYQLIYQGAYNTLAEMYTARSDDLAAQDEMGYQIQRKGNVSLDELPNRISDKTALNYLNFQLLCAGYMTNIIDDSGILPITAERGGKLYND